jgi:hypothetical protein
MKLFRVIAFAVCLQAPLAVALPQSKPLQYNLSKDSANFINQFNALSNKSVYVLVGGFGALCSCLAVKNGIELACTGEKIKRSILLAAIGLLALSGSMHLATNY